MSSIVDVAVVGLGPVGAILSALLGRAGINTVVFDKADELFPLPRAISFDHEVMRVIQNLGLSEAMVAHIAPYPPTEYRGIGGKIIARYEPIPPPYPQGWQPGFMALLSFVESAPRAYRLKVGNADLFRNSTEPGTSPF